MAISLSVNLNKVALLRNLWGAANPSTIPNPFFMKPFAVLLSMNLLVGAGCASQAPSGGTPVNVPAQSGGAERSVQGAIVAINLDAIAADGPAVITVRTPENTEQKIHVPSFGLPHCAARNNIAEVSTLKVGDAVEARGTVGEEGAIVPCEAEAHYLRVKAK